MSETTGRARSIVVVALISAAGCLDFVDRLVFGSAAGAIKHDLHLSDATLGALGGTAFALLYAVAVIPFAMLGDRGYSAKLSAAGITVWSAATMLVGQAQGVAVLAAGRLFTGLGQSAYSPTSSSLTAAYSNPDKRNVAFALNYGGSYLGLVAGFAGGGYLVDHIGWRATFGLLGFIGLPIGALMFWLIREPAAPHESPEAESWRALLANRPLRALLWYSLWVGVLGYAADLWGVSFYIRSFGLTAEQAGAWMGLGGSVATVIGTIAGGPIADRLARRGGPRAAMRFAAIALLLSTPIGIWNSATYSLPVALATMIGGNLVGALCAAPVFAAVPSVVPVHRRNAAAALYALVGNAVGLAVGPLMFGTLSDLLQPHFGAESLRMSLLVASVLGFLPVFHLFQAERRLSATPV